MTVLGCRSTAPADGIVNTYRCGMSWPCQSRSFFLSLPLRFLCSRSIAAAPLFCIAAADECETSGQNYCSRSRFAAPLFCTLLGRQLTRSSARHSDTHACVATKRREKSFQATTGREKEGHGAAGGEEALFDSWKCLEVSVKGIRDDALIA